MDKTTVKAVIDSDILIDFLQGVHQAKREIQQYSEKCISLISWMEVLSGAGAEEEEKRTRAFLGQFRVLAITIEIAEKAIQFRRINRLKLPDALIWATAEMEGCILVTRNSRDFDPKHPGIRIPYRI